MSKVLMLAICSNHKVESSDIVPYQSTWRVAEFAPGQLADKLYTARRRVRDLITSDKVARDGKLLRDMPFNSNLMNGPDFEGTDANGSYLPALQRYDGRFYRELGNTKERGSRSLRIKHHLLIVSGLYGLLTPTEQIQCYSCHVPDHPDIARTWVQKVKTDLLTSLIVAYINHFGIVRVFDFMAVDAYRNMVSWEMIRHAVRGNVLHCYSQQFAGPALLPSLGHLANRLLMAPETNLLAIKPHDTGKVPNCEPTAHVACSSASASCM